MATSESDARVTDERERAGADVVSWPLRAVVPLRLPQNALDASKAGSWTGVAHLVQGNVRVVNERIFDIVASQAPEDLIIPSALLLRVAERVSHILGGVCRQSFVPEEHHPAQWQHRALGSRQLPCSQRPPSYPSHHRLCPCPCPSSCSRHLLHHCPHSHLHCPHSHSHCPCPPAPPQRRGSPRRARGRRCCTRERRPRAGGGRS